MAEMEMALEVLTGFSLVLKVLPFVAGGGIIQKLLTELTFV
jgi:hypothetical protein